MTSDRDDLLAREGQEIDGPLTGANALAWLIAGKVVHPQAVGADDPLRTLVDRVAAANGRGALAVYTDAMRDHPDRDAIMAQVRAANVEAGHSTTSLAIPALPPEARPDPELAAQAGRWLDRYTRFCESISPMTPRSFHESGGLWLYATGIARRLRVPMSFGRVYPNLYMVWIAPTTIFHKTTGMGVPRNLARRHFPHLLAPQDTTPEALLSDMAGKAPTKVEDLTDQERMLWVAERNFCAQRSLCLDEMSGLMASAGKDYNAGLMEAFLRFYDCEDQFKKSTRGQGRLYINSAYMSILGASTPRALAPHLSSEPLWSNGWWPRHGMLTPDVDFPAYAEPTNTGQPPDDTITWPLRRLMDWLPDQTYPQLARPLTVPLGEGVHAKWKAYSKTMSYDLLREGVEDQLRGTYGRMPTQVIKIATLLAAMDWTAQDGSDPGPRIELPHLHRAITIAEEWRASAHRALEQGAVAEENIKLSRLLRQAAKADARGMSVNELRHAMRDVPPSEVRLLIDLALESGQLVEGAPDEKRGRGKPTQRFRIAFT